MPRYVLADSANGDIDGILSVIVGENEDAAWKWYKELHEKFGILAHSPRIGRIRDDLLPSIYMFPFGNYMIFYDAVPGGVEILHVVHGKPDVRRAFFGD